MFGQPTSDFLRSIGFRFSSVASGVAAPAGYTFEKLLTRHHRIECRKTVGAEAFGPVFEEIIAQLLLGTFRYDILRKVKIEDEGTGGDYDLLAFNSPYLLYVECKSGNSFGFREVFERHQFLAPALTLILQDVSKDKLRELVKAEVQPVLTEHVKKGDPNIMKLPDYSYPIEELSKPGEAHLLMHTFRNIYLTSGEDVERSIQRSLRHFHQVVQQTGYWS